MPVRIPVSTPSRPSQRWDGPQVAVVVLSLAGAIAAALCLWTLPLPLILPALSVLIVFAAAGLALVAWMRPHRPASVRVTYWDIVGALTFIGICAALLSDPEQVVPLLEARRAQ
jgi:hypothetical protein